MISQLCPHHIQIITLQWSHNERDGVSNHWRLVSIACSNVSSGVDQRKHQSSASLAFVRGIHRGPVNSPHKRPVTRKMFPFDDVIIFFLLFPFPDASHLLHLSVGLNAVCLVLCLVILLSNCLVNKWIHQIDRETVYKVMSWTSNSAMIRTEPWE